MRKEHYLYAETRVLFWDKIKKSVIKDNGYLVYVIKDMGKEDPTFVLAQFAIFLEYINSL